MAASHPCYIHSFCRVALEVDQSSGIELFTSREDPVRWLCTVVALWQNKAKISTGEGWCAEAWKKSSAIQKLSQFWATVVIMWVICLGTSQTVQLYSISAALLCSNSTNFTFDREDTKKIYSQIGLEPNSFNGCLRPLGHSASFERVIPFLVETAKYKSFKSILKCLHQCYWYKLSPIQDKLLCHSFKQILNRTSIC